MQFLHILSLITMTFTLQILSSTYIILTYTQLVQVPVLTEAHNN